MKMFSMGILDKTLHAISGSLLIPVIAGLVFLLGFGVVELGVIAWERLYRARAGKLTIGVARFLERIEEGAEPEEIIKEIHLPASIKINVENLLSKRHVNESCVEIFANRLLEEAELKAAKTQRRTDMIAKLGPALGLMGTLIPLGPGLAALGKGNIEMLAKAVTIAFDTTVAGLAAGAIGYIASKIRRGWHEDDLSALSAIFAAIVSHKNHPKMLWEKEAMCLSNSKRS